MSLTTTITLTIAVQEVFEEVNILDNDIAPNEIANNAEVGSLVRGLDLLATDEAGTALSDVMWGLSSINASTDTSAVELFTIDSTSGVISLVSTATLVLDGSSSVRVVVTAVAMRQGMTVTGYLTMTIGVLEILESWRILDSDGALNTLDENSTTGTTVSGLRLQVQNSSDSEIVVRWRLAPNSSDLFTIDPRSGEVSVVSNQLDYEETSFYTIAVRASTATFEVAQALQVRIDVLNVLEDVRILG